MPDRRAHRGPHPDDVRLFAADLWPRLREATRDLSWLLTRGYASPSALKIVGDRYGLDARQRVAVARCGCADKSAAERRSRQVQLQGVRGQELWIDGYNVLTSIEAAWSGGVILHARDGCYRDMASMHGSYRTVTETEPAIELMGELLAKWEVAACRWLLDQPVSNSGRLAAMLREAARARGWPWEAEVVPDPDAPLGQTDQIVATSDSVILDCAARWFNLARLAIDARVPDARIVDLSA